MSSFKQQILVFTAISGIYCAILGLAFPQQIITPNLVAIGVALIVFVLSALITTSSAATDAEANTQKFMLGTTVQMLVALFFILIARFVEPMHFRSMSTHFLILFFSFLIVQAILLVRRVRSVK